MFKVLFLPNQKKKPNNPKQKGRKDELRDHCTWSVKRNVLLLCIIRGPYVLPHYAEISKEPSSQAVPTPM